MWSNPERRHSTITLRVVAVLLTVGEVHSLKCLTTDHSRRQGEFIDIAEQCNNSSAGSRTTGYVDGDYSSSRGAGDRRNSNGNNNTPTNSNNNRRNADNGGGGRRNNNREYNVRRQDFGDGSNSNNNNNRGIGADYNDRGFGTDYSNNGRGNGGDRDSTPLACDYQSQQHSNNGGRPMNQQQGNPYYSSSVDYDARQSNLGNRQPNMQRRYRRRAAAATSGSKLLGNNRFRNVTNGGASRAKASILDQMDACTIHCVFNQLEMLNLNSRPDKSSIANIMTNHIKDVELKEFVQDSIDECFDTLELDTHNNKCEFSKNFAICMENKAQKNCDDWNENGFTNKINSAQDENNQPDKRRGY